MLLFMIIRPDQEKNKNTNLGVLSGSRISTTQPPAALKTQSTPRKTFAVQE
jgi:hypothetical protein